MENNTVVCEHCKTKHRSDSELKSLNNRLSRIEGQIRGIRGMLENDAYCPDILVQISAVTSALGSLGKEILSTHIKECVAQGVKNGDENVIDELCSLMTKMIK